MANTILGSDWISIFKTSVSSFTGFSSMKPDRNFEHWNRLHSEVADAWPWPLALCLY